MKLNRHLTAKTVLNSPGSHLNCIGQFTAHTKFKNNWYSFTVFVIRGETASNLLSRSVAEQMGLVKRIQEVHSAVMQVGLLKTQPVKITLQENAEPYAVYAARRIPIPLMKPVKEELDRMEAEGIIERVREPTEWCAPIVPAPKKS